MGWLKKNPGPASLWIKDGSGRGRLTAYSVDQFARWDAEGKLRQVCTVHIIDPRMDDPRVETWTVTSEPVGRPGYIDQETYLRYRDEAGDIFAITNYVDDRPKLYFAPKPSWAKLYDALQPRALRA